LKRASKDAQEKYQQIQRKIVEKSFMDKVQLQISLQGQNNFHNENSTNDQLRVRARKR
jgi:hypothetical protein